VNVLGTAQVNVRARKENPVNVLMVVIVPRQKKWRPMSLKSSKPVTLIAMAH
jgi:hypothetical protein